MIISPNRKNEKVVLLPCRDDKTRFRRRALRGQPDNESRYYEAIATMGITRIKQ